MGRLAEILVPRRSLERRDGFDNPSVNLAEALTWADDGALSTTGVSMSPQKALQTTAVYASVRVIAESCASLSLPVYEREGRSRNVVPDDPRNDMLNVSPNPEQTAMELWEGWFAHALLWGRGYSYVLRDKGGRPRELWPLPPNATKEQRTAQGSLYYTTVLASGEARTLMPENVLVLNSLMGLSPVKVAREALAIAAAAEQYAGRFWANNARPGGVIEFDGPMDDDEFQEFRRRWRAGHEGLQRSQLIGILTGGAHWRDVGIAPGLAQFIESRQFSVREIARLFRVPPHLIADLEGTVTRASIEQQSIEFVTYTLRSWLVRGEQRIRHRLFNAPADKERDVYPEFSADELLRGDMVSRFKAYQVGILTGFLSRADARERERLPVVEGQGLEDFLIPLNLGASADFDQEEPVEEPPVAEPSAAAEDRSVLAARMAALEARVGGLAALLDRRRR